MPNRVRTRTELWRRLLSHRVIDHDTGCWLWDGAHKDENRPVITVNYRVYVVAKLVGIVWLGLKKGQQVNHTCDNSFCWNPSHLYVGTQSQNAQDAYGRGRHVVKLRPEQVLEIRAAKAAGAKSRDLAKQYGVSELTICHINRNKTWHYLDRYVA